MGEPEKKPEALPERQFSTSPEAWFKGEETRPDRIGDLPDNLRPSDPMDEDELGDVTSDRTRRDLLVGPSMLAAGILFTIMGSGHLVFYGLIGGGFFYSVRGIMGILPGRSRDLD